MLNSNYKRSEGLIDASESLLLVIDVQERFRSHIHGMDGVIRNCTALTKGAAMLGIPTLYSEQYPKGLGTTIPEVRQEKMTAPVEKLTFSALQEPAFFQQIKAHKKKQIVVVGVETHVCVTQTVLDLIHNGAGWVYVVADAVSSRTTDNRDWALKRLAKHGADIVTTEMVLMEWLQKAGTTEFKEMQGWIR